MKKGYIRIRVKGKNVNNYLKWLIKNKVDIINVNVLNHSTLELTTNNCHYQKLNKYSKTYEIKIIKKYGLLQIIDNIKNNKFILISIIIAILFLYFLSNIIFDIEVISNNQEIVQKIKTELKKYDIEKFKFKKKYDYLIEVKEQILNNNKETLEWIEIVENGTKYIVKLVERKKEKQIKDYKYQSIVASKDAIITSIKAYAGEKTKDINEYIKRNEVIVSGILTKSNGEQLYQKAKATIHGEVWYKIDIEYPFAYYEEKLTGKRKNVLVINFLNYKIPIFSYSKYKEFKIKTNNIVENQIVPINLSKEKQYEVEIKEEIYTWEEAISNAVNFSKKKLLESNNKILEIKNVQILNKQMIGSKVKLSLFISVIEDITKIIEVKQEENSNEINLQN